MSTLHVYLEAPEDYAVWLDGEGGSDRDGLCLGVGSTEAEALRDAIADLEKVLHNLRHRAKRLRARD